jgi:hypothetical protein
VTCAMTRSCTARWSNPEVILVATNLFDSYSLIMHAIYQAKLSHARVLLVHVFAVSHAMSEATDGFSICMSSPLVRSLKRKLEEIAAEHARLEGVSSTASNKHEALIDEFKEKTLLTKSEKAEWAERIAAAKQRAESAFLAESNQQTLYNQLVYREAEAAKAYTESVNAANDIQREINRLSR